jgi:3-dehydroquinate synthase
MMSVHVELGERSYDIAITRDDQRNLGAFARARCRSTLALVVTDENVVAHADAVAASLIASGIHAEVKVVAAGESSKSLAVLSKLYDRLADLRADRKTLIAAVGGGVVGDLAGFAAATYNRGLPLLMVPTTLLAMVDSSVGGKVGINHPRGKNLIGAFHQPVGVWIDTDFLQTLLGREYRSGLAEVVKYGVILDPELFEYLESNSDAVLYQEPAAVQHIIARSCRLKADVVEKDERELTGLRAILNYGHTFAHAFETVAGYGTWLHGEAVAAGMVCASRLAERRRLVAEEVTARQVRLLEKFALPVKIDLKADDLLAVMRNDKKVESGRLRFVLPRRLGEVGLYDDVPEEDVRSVLSEIST